MCVCVSVSPSTVHVYVPLGLSCITVDMSCITVNMSCITVDMSCITVDMSCITMNMSCITLEMSCITVDMSCITVDMSCITLAMRCITRLCAFDGSKPNMWCCLPSTGGRGPSQESEGSRRAPQDETYVQIFLCKMAILQLGCGACEVYHCCFTSPLPSSSHTPSIPAPPVPTLQRNLETDPQSHSLAGPPSCVPQCSLLL